MSVSRLRPWRPKATRASGGRADDPAKHYAILDDDADADMHTGAFFRTEFREGLTDEIAGAVIGYLGAEIGECGLSQIFITDKGHPRIIVRPKPYSREFNEGRYGTRSLSAPWSGRGARGGTSSTASAGGGSRR